MITGGPEGPGKLPLNVSREQETSGVPPVVERRRTLVNMAKRPEDLAAFYRQFGGKYEYAAKFMDAAAAIFRSAGMPETISTEAEAEETKQVNKPEIKPNLNFHPDIHLGDAVKAWRTRRELKVTELADRVGKPISRGYISEVENNKIRNPNDEYLIRLADALNIPIEYLVLRVLPEELPSEIDSLRRSIRQGIDLTFHPEHQLGDAVKAWRTVEELTLTELANRAGKPISRGYISEVENNKIRNPNDEYLIRLADALNIPIEYLVLRMLPSDLEKLAASPDASVEDLQQRILPPPTP